MNEAIVIDGRRELFVDHALIERLEDARLVLHRPQPQEVALNCDAPWETNAPGYATVLKDGETCRMYYRANPGGSGTDGDRTQVTCLAQSDDGIHWSRPGLGLFDFQGSKRNNIVWQGVISHNLTPFLDENPDCPLDERYKAVGGVGMGQGGLWALVSPDGIRWRTIGDHPLSLKGNFDSQNLVFWDTERGEYRAYWRDHRRDDPKVPEGRDIRTATSVDFLTWSEAQWLDYDPNRSGSNEQDQTDDPTGDHHQLYTSNVQPYYRAPHFRLAFPARYSDRGWTPSTDALPDREERRTLADQGVAGGRPTRLGTVLWDTLFMASRDGQAFTVWPEAFVRPGIQRPGSWFYGQASCVWGMVETASGLVGAPPELSFYVRDNARSGGPYRLRRHTLRLDGFTSVFAPLSGGQVLTRPLRFSGSRLEINFSTSAGGRLRAEIQDEQGRAIPGFALADCHLQYGDQLDRVVSWEQGTDVGDLAGKPVRLRFELKDADLYSFQFQG